MSSILRTPLALIGVGFALALVGCGGSSNQSSEEAALPRAIAQELAAKSDAIASALDDDDVCGAAQRADELKDAVDAALSGGQIPPALGNELEQTAADLQNEINCDRKGDEDKNKGKGDGNGNGQDKKDDATTTATTTIGTTISTTTEGEG